MVSEAQRYASVLSRSVPKQIEHWVKIGKIAEDNPDLPYEFIKNTLLGLEDIKAGEISEYDFG